MSTDDPTNEFDLAPITPTPEQMIRAALTKKPRPELSSDPITAAIIIAQAVDRLTAAILHTIAPEVESFTGRDATRRPPRADHWRRRSFGPDDDDDMDQEIPF